jgi:hypothetical protein
MNSAPNGTMPDKNQPSLSPVLTAIGREWILDVFRDVIACAFRQPPSWWRSKAASVRSRARWATPTEARSLLHDEGLPSLVLRLIGAIEGVAADVAFDLQNEREWFENPEPGALDGEELSLRYVLDVVREDARRASEVASAKEAMKAARAKLKELANETEDR